MKNTVIALAVAVGLLSATAIPNKADAHGCIMGAMAGGVAGHMAGHTFLGMFGGCAGGMVVHKMYANWHAKHPNGTMREFVAEHRSRLPAGWAEKLESEGFGDVRPAPGR